MKRDDFKSQFKNCPLVYLIRREKETLENHENFRRLLEILEVDVDKLQIIKQPTRFEKIILPDESYSMNMYTSEYYETIDRLRNFALKNKTPTSSKKIYYFHGARQIGEERLAEYFRSKGYEIIRPEKLTLDEQLNFLINCESFATTIGSTSHNSVFLRNGIETIFIPRGADSPLNPYQRSLNQVNSVNANYVDSTLSLFSKRGANHVYIISPHLKKFFGDKFDGYEEDDFKNFLQYIKNCMSKNLIVNPKAKEYYAPFLPDFMTQLKQHQDLIEAYNMPPRWDTFQPPLTYQTHVQSKGWSVWLDENQISNDIEQERQIEALKINFPSHKVYYSVYYDDKEGWSEEVSNGEQAGTTGKAKPIMGIRIRLDEAGAKEFDILYRVHKFDGQWTDWAKNGEVIYSHRQKLNAVQIKLETKN